MKAIILASGFGTRLYPLTRDKAKALLVYKGKPVVGHIIDRIPVGMETFVTSNGKFENDFRQLLETLSRPVNLCVEPVFTETERLGAVGSLRSCIETGNLVDDLLVIAGDNYFEFELSRFIAVYDGETTLVAVFDIGDKGKASQLGVVKLDGHRIIKFDEKPARPETTLVATACYIFPPRIRPLLSQFCDSEGKDNLGSFISFLLARDEVHAYVFTESWLDIGSVAAES